MTHRNKGGSYRTHVVLGQHQRVSWVELRETFVSADGEVCGYSVLASAGTADELAARLLEWVGVVEAYQGQEQG